MIHHCDSRRAAARCGGAMDVEPFPVGSAGTWQTTVPPSAATEVANVTNEASAVGTAGQNLYSVFVVLVACVLVSVTVVGNIMVMVSFHIDKQLQTISNYFLLSLAVADFAIGLISMPLYTVYLVMGRWVMGPAVCDTWLALDYLASNASVLNLLIISFDRYFSVTRPLTYRARRTNRRAAAMIASAWGVSLVLWPPWIYAWPYIEGQRTVEPHECYIQFLETNHYWTFGTAIAAFYLPVLIMCGLYYRIWLETEQRQRDLSHLQAGKNSSRRSNSSLMVAHVAEATKWCVINFATCWLRDLILSSFLCIRFAAVFIQVTAVVVVADLIPKIMDFTLDMSSPVGNFRTAGQTGARQLALVSLRRDESRPEECRVAALQECRVVALGRSERRLWRSAEWRLWGGERVAALEECRVANCRSRALPRD
ncbi:muscarinic acetylcholine receptor DM1-like [Pollicipes pollicipes]|uniref:muscarinic acetylcholine receptor DM1-like n=1 Tax=Pollicipes pollicipes TaxID=41117 RepID=UPI0018858620|nr:muscarinic acetylcholine receptor DM1-like [Pollicipes pollicipes]